MLCVCSAWVGRDPSFASIAALLPFVGGVIVLEIRERQNRRNPLKQTQHPIHVSDLNLYRRYISHFTSNPNVLGLLRDHDFANAFSKQQIEPLWEYVERWTGAESEFIDHRLELARRNFDTLLRQFVTLLARNTFPDNRQDECFTLDFESSSERPDILKTREKLNNLSTDVFRAFEAFHRLGKWIFKGE